MKDSMQQILDNEENILWSEKPNRWAYIFAYNSCVTSSIGFFIFIPLTAFVVYMFRGSGFSNIAVVISITPFVIVGLSLLFNQVIRYFMYKREKYAITDRRLLIKSGLWSDNFKTIDYDQIDNVSVKITLVDQLLGQNTGTIVIGGGDTVYHDSGKSPINVYFSGIAKPYSVFKKLKEVSMDIKSDIEFPNEYRPDKNPGYNTMYKKDN